MMNGRIDGWLEKHIESRDGLRMAAQLLLRQQLPAWGQQQLGAPTGWLLADLVLAAD